MKLVSGPDTIRSMSTSDAQAIQIEPGVAFPGNRVTYPFAAMGPGDSFFLSDMKRANAARVASIRFMRCHEPGWVFKLRRVDGGWRLWRLA